MFDAFPAPLKCAELQIAKYEIRTIGIVINSNPKFLSEPFKWIKFNF
jgi:hypothetical protein